MSTHKLADLKGAALSQEEKAPAGSKMVCWYSKTTSDRQLGGWPGALSTVVSAGFGYFAFSGIYSNLVLYLIRVWKASNAGAANDLTNLVGTMYFTSVIGGFLSDTYWGRLWTVLGFQIIFAACSVLVAIAVTLQQSSPAEHLSSGLRAFLFFGLYLTALGCGSYEPGIAALGGDQFDTPRQKATYFNWMTVFCNLGELPALTFLTYFENEGKWALGFWISSGTVVLSIPIFMAGVPFCRQYRPAGNPLVRVLQVLVCVSRKMNVKPETDPELLYEVPGEYSVMERVLKIQHRDKLRSLDKAATITKDDARHLDSVSAWHLCTVTQVEEVKGWISIIPVFIIGVVANGVFSQAGTLFVEQGTTMDGTLGTKGFKIPPGSMQIVTVVVIIVLAPIYDYILVPLCKRWTGNPKGITSLQRMGWGLLWTTMGMVVAGVIENKRLEEFQHAKMLSIFWLVPQYAILGVGALLLVVGQMDFFYSEISENVRSLGMCLTLVCRGLGSFVSTLLVSTVTSISSHHGRYLGWIPKQDLNLGHLDYFYWTLASLMFVTFLIYVIYANHYVYLGQRNSIRSNDKVQSKSLPIDIEGVQLQSTKV